MSIWAGTRKFINVLKKLDKREVEFKVAGDKAVVPFALGKARFEIRVVLLTTGEPLTKEEIDKLKEESRGEGP